MFKFIKKIIYRRSKYSEVKEKVIIPDLTKAQTLQDQLKKHGMY